MMRELMMPSRQTIMRQQNAGNKQPYATNVKEKADFEMKEKRHMTSTGEICKLPCDSSSPIESSIKWGRVKSNNNDDGDEEKFEDEKRTTDGKAKGRQPRLLKGKQTGPKSRFK